jgi:hypothetical protein
MRCLQVVWQGGKLAVLTMANWLAVHGAALAQGMAPKKPENGGGSYIVPYTLVIVGIGLGLLLVCRSSRRRDRAKPEQYEEWNLAGKKPDEE